MGTTPLSPFYRPKRAGRSKFLGWVGSDQTQSAGSVESDTDQIQSDLIVASSSGAVPRPDRKGGGQRTSCQEAKVAC